MRIITSAEENQKITVMAVLIAFSCFLTVYFHLVLGICTIFTHFIYIPVILASFWWKRKGIVVAVFLAGVLIIGHKLISGDVGIDEDYLRGFSFILVSSVVAFLSERVAREEEMVRDSHAELDQIFQTAADGMRVVDKDFNMLRTNDTFLELAGISRDKAAGRKCYEVFPGPHCHTPDCCLARILGGEEYLEDEVEKERADGKKIPCIVTATPFRESGGDVIGIVEDFRDITERKRAEEEIKFNHAELDQIFQTAADGMRVVDKDFNMLRTNETFLELAGISRDKAAGRKCFEVLPGPLCHTPGCPLTRILGGEEYVEDEVEKKRADGKKIPCIVTATPFRESGGDVIGIVEDFKDITDRKLAEEELIQKNEELHAALEQISATEEELRQNFDELARQEEALRESELTCQLNEDYLKKIFTSVQAGIFIIDAQSHRILDINPAAVKMIGAPKEDIIGQVCHQFVCPAEHGKCPITDLSQTVDNSERELITADGSRLSIIKYVIPVMLGGRTCLLETFIDNTQRRNAEAAIRIANNKLNLLSSITRHDIRNKLLALSAYLQLSKEALTDSSAISGYLEKAERIAETIGRQIAFTKEYEDLGVSTPVWQRLSIIVRSAVSQMPANTITFEISVNDVELYADPLLIKVFYNLFDNSLQHGGAVTHIHISHHPAGTGLIIIIADNGIGISPEDKQHLFKRGFGKHNGLGLFLSREILSITEITIEETGEFGKGARFEINVPKGGFRIREKLPD